MSAATTICRGSVFWCRNQTERGHQKSGSNSSRIPSCWGWTCPNKINASARTNCRKLEKGKSSSVEFHEAEWEKVVARVCEETGRRNVAACSCSQNLPEWQSETVSQFNISKPHIWAVKCVQADRTVFQATWQSHSWARVELEECLTQQIISWRSGRQNILLEGCCCTAATVTTETDRALDFTPATVCLTSSTAVPTFLLGVTVRSEVAAPCHKTDSRPRRHFSLLKGFWRL